MTKHRRANSKRNNGKALALALALCVVLSGCAGRWQTPSNGSSPASGSVVAGSSIPQTGQEAVGPAGEAVSSENHYGQQRQAQHSAGH